MATLTMAATSHGPASSPTLALTAGSAPYSSGCTIVSEPPTAAINYVKEVPRASLPQKVLGVRARGDRRR